MYYISNVLIPPLERIFSLVGADVRQWFLEMPKTQILGSNSPIKAVDIVETHDRLNIEEHFHSSQCINCGGPQASQGKRVNPSDCIFIYCAGLCDDCFFAPQQTMVNLSHRIQANQKRLANAHRICGTCTGSEPTEPIKCESLDCPWLFSRKRAENKEELLVALQDLLDNMDYSMGTGTLHEDASKSEDEHTVITGDDSGVHSTTPES